MYHLVLESLKDLFAGPSIDIHIQPFLPYGVLDTCVPFVNFKLKSWSIRIFSPTPSPVLLKEQLRMTFNNIANEAVSMVNQLGVIVISIS